MEWILALVGAGMIVWGIRLESSYSESLEVAKERAKTGFIVGFLGILIIGVAIRLGGD